jgi:predicted NUDIX family NTP pyrophosphohydrolase
MASYTREAYERDIQRTSKGRCDNDQVAVMLDHAFETVKWMKTDLGDKWQIPLGKFFDREKVVSAQQAQSNELGVIVHTWALYLETIPSTAETLLAY